MKRKIVLTLLASMFLMQSVQVSAQSLVGGTSTETVSAISSSFTLDTKPQNLSKVIVSLPASMQLELDETEDNFVCNAEVSAKGDLSEECQLEIRIPNAVAYYQEGSDDASASGDISWDDNSSYQIWTPEQLEEGKTTPNPRGISASVKNTDSVESGNHSGVVDFNIKVVNIYEEGSAALTTKESYVVEGDTLKILPYYTYLGKKKTTRIETIGFDYLQDKYPEVTKIIIPDTVEEIGDSAFEDCRNITSVTLPKSLKNIGSEAFRGCYNLSELVIPSGEIGRFAFYECTNLTTLIIQDGVTSIGNSAFAWCSNLTSVNISDSVTSIGDSAFYYCNSLTSITIPNSVTSIGDSAFGECNGLTSITIPDSVTSIGDSAFGECNGLTSITIPDSVTSMGNNVFFDCSSLTTVNISDNVTSIGNYAFSGCRNLTTINIPDSVTIIGERAFSGCNSLTTVNIPDSVTSIGEQAFSGCSSLTTVNIPDSVTSIGGQVFYDCCNLPTINYSGTQAQFQQISGYTYLKGKTIQCSDGDFFVE